MTAGRPDLQVVRRHLVAMREALANLRKHGAVTAQRLRERGAMPPTTPRRSIGSPSSA